jgi:hypothetical protein
MSVSIYEASVPTFVQILGAQSSILDKAAAYAEAKKIDEAVLLGSRLFPDMFPFKKQIQVETDFANRGSARLSGSEIPSYPDDEQTIADLKARIAKTLDFIGGLNAAQFDGSETKIFQIPIGGEKKMEMTGKDYLFHFALPNFFFHATTAYAILRHCGLEVGKLDFMQAQS